MHPFQAEISEILGHLQEAHAKIEAVHNQEILLLRNKILQNLKREIDILKLQLGIEPDLNRPPMINPHAGPLKRMFGKDITPAVNRPAADVNKPFHQTVEDVELAELRLKADELYPKFLSASSDHLLDSVSDIEIRAVAKKAGLPVTETNPDRITTAYIDQIKTAIQQQNAGKDVDLTDKNIDEPGKKIDALYSEFTTIENKEILEVYSDPEIREVALMAGLPVTAKTPAKIDAKFLNQIKNAIKKQLELNALAGNV